MGRKKANARDDENPAQGGAKSKKKGLLIDDDEYAIGTEVSEEPEVQEEKVVITGKKKGKKGGSKASEPKGNDEEKALDEVDNDDEDDHREVVFAGKKKGKSKKGKGNSSVLSGSSFGLLEDDDDDKQEDAVQSDEEDVAPVVSLSGKKKPSKKSGNSLFSASVFDAIDDDNDDDNDGEVVDDDEEAPIEIMGKKKKSSKGGKKGGSLFTASGFDALEDEAEPEDEKKDEEDEFAQIAFSGKKKKSSKAAKKGGGSSFNAVLLDEGIEEDVPVDEDASVIAFSGKKKSSKKKGNSVFSQLNEEVGDGNEVTDAAETEPLSVGNSNNGADESTKVNKSQEVAGTSKNKKKKKKGGRTEQEEDDLDKILAELGEAPPIPKAAAPTQEEKVQVEPETAGPVDDLGEKEGEEENVESAAAKKKKKKKEKEKEKKAAAAAAAAASVETKVEKPIEVKTEAAEPKKNESKGKAADKKLPKHVREMQEALARRKEAEEKAKREEEEKLRREEEERRKQEELEKQAEEARRKKKEREKEKLQKKKLEGKLLTGKQKEEARRLEAMRNQILANAGVPIPTNDTGARVKKPLYQKKKSKPIPHQVNGAGSSKPVEDTEEKESQPETVSEVNSVVSEKVEETDDVDEKSEVAESVKENGIEEEEEDDDEWDAKSWDDATVNISVSAFADEEEADSETKLAPKKVVKNTASSAVASTKPVQSQDVDNKKNPEPEVTEKKKTKNATVKKATQNSDATPKAEKDLRSPICCIMGHVDTGKTKLLDCIRGTNVQEGEAGGITQQIGATYFPAANIRDRTKELKADATLKVPGLLVIDTPGHESFTNLRSRGSGLCDIAILVVDIMHGLEPQTIESLNLLKMRNTEFIIALNKVDRLYGWKSTRNAPIVKALKQQSKDVQNEFNMRLTQIVTQFKEQGLNTELYYKNREMGETYSIVPTSAITGEGIPDMLLLLVQWTQKTMVEKLTFSNEVQCTVLEVKVIEGHGTTIDVVLVNGVLHEGDQIVVCGMQGPIVTSIRALLTPHPMKELRVKGTYLHHKEIKAAQGIKITAQGLEHAIAGTALYVVGPDDDVEDIKETTMEDMKSVMSRIDKSGEGVCVQASTLGSLEALLEFLKTPEVNIPVSGISIGPVHKKDVMKASVMLEKKKEYATILAFDVKVTPESRELAEELGVKIFIADIIYHLFDQFKAYIDNLKEEKKKEAADEVVFPCVLKILPNCIFNKKDPIVLGVDILEGIAKVGTPICIPQKEFIDIGRIASIENNHKPVDTAKKGQKVAIKIVGSNSEEQQKMFGRHFEIEDELVSHISRKSIDILKANYREDLSNEDWRLVLKLRNLFRIQ
ncbi:hypothetical protein CsatA_029046 [Cannabis sativa]